VIGHVEALGGTVSSVSGAGLVAIFGAPDAHEDDPERALRAAFRSVRSLTSRDQDLYVRVGVETGQALVGPIGVGAGTHYGAVGEAVSVAAALQSFSKPASVLVGPATHRATEGLFEWSGAEEVGMYPAGPPVVAHYLERPRARLLDAGRRGMAGPVPLVGRASELSLFRDAVREVTAGRGGVVVIVAEPGLGKTRLVQECRKLFMAWVGAASGRLPLWLEGRAVSYRSTTPYGLYQQLLCAWVGVAPEEDEEVARAALTRALKAVFGEGVDDDQVGLLSQVMGFGPGRAALALSHLGPEPLQRASFVAVQSLISRLMAYGPTVLVLEDLHWADPTSLRLTELVASLAEGGPLLLVATRRPEPDPGGSALEGRLLAGGDAHRLRLALGPLPECPQRELARGLLGEGATEEIVRAVSDGVEGNPLFLEERVSSLLETRALARGEDGRWRLDLGAPGQVPEALERLVRARVDRLPAGPREAIVAASVLGQEFSRGALANVTDLGDGLAPAISELCSARLLVELRTTGEPAYRFRHSLIQEAVYRGLLKKQRARLHARAAWGLERASEGRQEEAAGRLGHHFAMADEPERAAHYLGLAGDGAASGFANDEAVSCYRWALELLGGKEELALTAVELWLKLGALFWRLGRYAEGRAALQEAAELVPTTAPLLAARCHRWLGQLEIEDSHDAQALAALNTAEDILERSTEKRSDSWVEAWLEVQLSRSNLHYWRNECDLQAAALSRARLLAESRAGAWQKADFYMHLAGQRWRARRFAVDDRTLADVRAARSIVAEAGLDLESFHWQTLGFVLLLKGNVEAAQAELGGALGAARRAGDGSLEHFCLTFLAWSYLRQHDLKGTKQMVQEAERVLQAHSFPSAGMMRAILPWVAWKEGRRDDVERLASEALSQWEPYIVRYPFCSICLWPLIAVRLAQGSYDKAMVAARELLEPPQMRLPSALEAAVGSALSTWDSGQHSRAVERLKRALAMAGALNFI
jgi:tetratricopeptide (TPR) repeat protein